ncbi:hypothetical protein ES705_13544 [subsurface metagenome]
MALPVMVLYGLAAYVRKTQARKLADRIIAGFGPNTAGQVNKCITILSDYYDLTLFRSEQDLHRIDQLRDIQNELSRQQNGINKNTPLGCV